MPTEPDPITLSEIARRATEIVDPQGGDDDVVHLYTQLEDDDRPITSVQNLEERLALAQEGLETDGENPAIDMAAAAGGWPFHSARAVSRRTSSGSSSSSSRRWAR